MEVLRVENEDGNGPYWLMGYAQVHGKEDEGSLRHPAPRKDGITDFQGAYVFGFSSAQQFKRWFSKSDRERMHWKDFKLNTYKVHGANVQKGTRQVAFRKNKARLVASERLI